MTTVLNANNPARDRAGRSKRFVAIPALAAAFSALLIVGCGGGGSSSSGPASSSNPPAPTPSSAPKAIAVYAGSAGGMGFVDGPGDIAHFGGPAGLVFDPQGNLLVADLDGRAIRKVNPATGETSTWAGALGHKGTFDGPLSEARFASNVGMVMASDGTLYLTDIYLGGVRMVTPQGLVETLAGCGGGTRWVDGIGPNAQFAQPKGIALDEAKKYLYVADSGHCVIRRVDITSTETITLAGIPRKTPDDVPGSADGTFESAQFLFPAAIAGPVENILYVGCSDSIRKVDLAKRTVTTLAGTPNVLGFADGVGANVRFNMITGLALDGRGHLLITEGGSTNNYCGQVVRSLDLANGAVTTLAGTGAEIPDLVYNGGPMGLGGWADGIGGDVRFDMPFGIALDATQSFAYITDLHNAIIRKMNLASGEVSTLAGIGPQVGATDGPAAKAAFRQPFGLALDAQGNAYVADTDNHLIRKITPQGVVSTLAGHNVGIDGGYEDGPGASASFSLPKDLAVDAKGNVFVADAGNYCIRKITPDGTVSTFAGIPQNPGWADGPGATAQFGLTQGLVLGPDGNLYVADSTNSAIRMIAPDGTVSTYAGTGNRALTDGLVSEAEFNQPWGITKDASGHLLVADTYNHAVRSIDLATGTVTTLAGNGSARAIDGDGSAAGFYLPVRIAADPSGFLLVSDYFNQAIRKVTPSGTVTTVVGALKDGQPSLMGIKLGDLPGQIKFPGGLAIAPDGSLLTLSDNCVLKISGIK
ncbi:MAG TPA: NHL repeat-containing protein [Holophagaceae bacterium]|nr:NHL repeat-containing protein [Holophagaceae bacterium]